jgi:hypothetical protein
MNNKLLKYMRKNLQTMAVAGLVAAAASIAQAQPYYFCGDWNGWVNNGNQMSGGPVTYTYVVPPGTGTPGAESGYKVTDGTWNNTWPSQNLVTKYDAGGGGTFYFTPGTIVDGWYPIANRVGYVDPGNLAFEVAGDFNGWSGGAGYQLNPIGNGVYSNSCVIPTAGSHSFKFRTPGSWSDLYFGSDFGNGGNNATFNTTTSPQTMPFVLDLPNGRWLVGTLAPPPVTNTIVFCVDMTIQTAIGHFNPNSDTVECRGDWTGWAAGAFVLSNTNAANTNLYYGVTNLINSPGATYGYKFWDSDALAGNNGYEAPTSTSGGNRTLTLLSANGTITLPTVFYADLASSASFLTEDTLVTFTVNMTNAVTAAGTTNVNGGTNFDPDVNSVYINGDWLPGGWWSWGWVPVSPPYGPYQLINNPVGSELYSITLTVPAGNSLALTYKFSIDGIDNELPAYVNHIRYIRNQGNYTLPLDNFGTQVTEPQLGPLTIGAPSGGKVPVSWLGLPEAYLQTSTNAGNPAAWVNHPETAAYGSYTGIYSTNYPVSGGALFFRTTNP